MLVETPAEGYAACCEALGALDLRPRLGAITAPTLVVTGEDDPVAPPDSGEQLAAAIPGARHEVVAGAAHIANVEQPAVFTELLLDHLSGETVP
jgi:3-oxoadipate enol-lactonase